MTIKELEQINNRLIELRIQIKDNFDKACAYIRDIKVGKSPKTTYDIVTGEPVELNDEVKKDNEEDNFEN
jgi:hypothetical protein